jgi:hypothetical protein
MSEEENQQVFRLFVRGSGWVSVRIPLNSTVDVAGALRKIAEYVEFARAVDDPEAGVDFVSAWREEAEEP